MPKRALLRRKITAAWQTVIRCDYNPGLINSERSLQAALWSRLSRRLQPQRRRMFIEPRLALSKMPDAVRYPDLVICNTRQVIGIIELKYQPRVQPSWDKDLKTFRWINQMREQLAVRNVRYLGDQGAPRRYGFAADILYVWAGVHRECDRTLQGCEEMAGLDFLPLQAVTCQGRDARCL